MRIEPQRLSVLPQETLESALICSRLSGLEGLRALQQQRRLQPRSGGFARSACMAMGPLCALVKQGACDVMSLLGTTDPPWRALTRGFAHELGLMYRSFSYIFSVSPARLTLQ